MVDWLSSMQQTFEYYIVDPNTWKDKSRLTTVKSCSINRDLDTETLGSATIDVTESISEAYVRVYLVTIQNGLQEKHPLGTFLVQTPSYGFDGKIHDMSMDAYTPLIELKENPPPIGYSIKKGREIMNHAYKIVRDNVRAPVIKADDDTRLNDHFIANNDDKWTSFIIDLIANAKYRLALDEMGRILFEPEQDTASLQPVWTYNDDNSSILYPEINMTQDLYGIPNVVEVVYSSNINGTRQVTVSNDDINSPISTVNRGRKIIHRVTNPKVSGNTNAELKNYATQLLRELSTLEYTVSYTHGYCPVRLGDCVRLNYSRAGLNNIKAKVISQSIKCETGCSVSEKAIFTKKLWR